MIGEKHARFFRSLSNGATFIALADSDSMAPSIHQGDTLIIERTSFAETRPRDIVAFYVIGISSIVVHRVDRIVRDGTGGMAVITRADAGHGDDPWIVTPENHLGHVRQIHPGPDLPTGNRTAGIR